MEVVCCPVPYLPAFANAPDAGPEADGLALHDAQSVIAREHGFASWNALRDEVEARSLSFDAAVEEFVRCATSGVPARAERLLALHPAIASATLHTALVLGDVVGVEAQLRANPELATQPGGPREWEPLLYVCHTCLHRSAPSRVDGLVPVARRLLELGADPNAEYHWNWHPELPRTALWAAVCQVNDLPLAEALLEAGANPTDGVTAHIAGGGGDLAALGADAGALDGMFAAPPLVWAVEGRNHPAPGSDHVAVARLLIEAGSPLDWAPPEGAPSPERTLEGLLELRRAAAP